MRRSSQQIDRFAYERPLLAQGLWPVAGVDEVGRGPLAGPVVAAAVVLSPAWIRAGMPAELTQLNDSKQLTEAQREDFFDRLSRAPQVRFGLGRIDPARIDAVNILRATHEAMNLALAALGAQPPPEGDPALPGSAVAPGAAQARTGATGAPASWSPAHVLVDGRRVEALRLPQTAIVKGDALSYSIAAASVLAKVTRDRLMAAFDQRYPGYGFAEHKGYGTPSHLEAIRRLGPCPIHRRSFAPMRPPELDLFTPAP